MEMYILGSPYQRPRFFIAENYRGLSRSSSPVWEDEKDAYASKEYSLWVGKHYSYLCDEKWTYTQHEAMEIINAYHKLSEEVFELVLATDPYETPPLEGSKFLGIEPIVGLETASLFLYTLGKGVPSSEDVEFSQLIEKYKNRLNENFLFSSTDDAYEFLDELKRYPNIENVLGIEMNIVRVVVLTVAD